jgi:hypothetical protein
MNLRNLFRVSAIFFLLFGLVWLLAPKAMPASYGLGLDAYGAYLLQIVGAINVSIAVLCLLVSGLDPSPARQAVVTFIILNQVLSGMVNLLAVLGGVVPGGTGWFGVALNILFGLAFGYFRFLRPEASMTAELQS